MFKDGYLDPVEE